MPRWEYIVIFYLTWLENPVTWLDLTWLENFFFDSWLDLAWLGKSYDLTWLDLGIFFFDSWLDLTWLEFLFHWLDLTWTLKTSDLPISAEQTDVYIKAV